MKQLMPIRIAIMHRKIGLPMSAADAKLSFALELVAQCATYDLDCTIAPYQRQRAFQRICPHPDTSQTRGSNQVKSPSMPTTARAQTACISNRLRPCTASLGHYLSASPRAHCDFAFAYTGDSINSL
jgi:hypothetical protein